LERARTPKVSGGSPTRVDLDRLAGLDAAPHLAEGALAARAQDHELVGPERLVGDDLAAPGGVDGVDPGGLLAGGDAQVALLDGHPLVAVLLGQQLQGLGLDAQAGVLGDEHHLALPGQLLGQVGRGGQDPVVLGVRGEGVGQVEPGGQADLDPDAAAAGQLDPLGEVALLAEALEGADGPPGRRPGLVGPGLELVQLLDHGQRDGDVMLLEATRGLWVGDEHVGVEHVGASHHLERYLTNPYLQ